MKRSLLSLVLAALLALTGCATVFCSPPERGMSIEEVIARKGQPDAKYQDGNTILLEWSVGAWGQYAYMARIGSDGKLIKYEQVLTREKFSTIAVNQFNKNDVLKTVGNPTETSTVSSQNDEIWSYRYKEDGIWDSMIHISFDSNGIVRRIENGSDPLYIHD